LRNKILLIDDEETFRDSVELMLSEHPIDIVWAKTGAEGIQMFRKSPNAFAVVVVDYVLPDHRGSDVCRHLRRENAQQLFLFTSQHFQEDFLKDQLRTGANGFVDKSSPTSEMRSEILRVVQAFESEFRLIGGEYEKTRAERDLGAHGFVGRSQVMFDMLQKMKSARDTKLPALIIGETGVGKEIVARALVPKGKNLVALSCAAYQGREHMLESDFFGYVKGAFTDAKQDTPGIAMLAHQNVLFLDELHLLPLGAQAKLLRFLQEMKFKRVGDHSAKETAVDFKLIAAVQPDIKRRLKDGRFMPDLIERVSTLMIEVPPLRARTDDIEILVAKFQEEFNDGRLASERKQFRISTIAEMERHKWPNNVRALKNAVSRMLTNCNSDIVNPNDFHEYLKSDLLSDNQQPLEKSTPLNDATIELEKQTIIDALKDSRTRVEAAARVGLPFTSFLRKLTKLAIDPNFYLKMT
jgi:two-component system response regulator AtoC